MIAFPEMLRTPAERAGIKVPPDVENYDKAAYPHWDVYTYVQLGRPMPEPASHWHNSRVIASIPDDEICLVTMEDLLKEGVDIGYSYDRS